MQCQCFTPSRPSGMSPTKTTRPKRFSLCQTDSDSDEKESSSSSVKTSLEEKMKSWEPSEEEVKASTLGGVVPKRKEDAERSGAFDVGLYIAFPLMVLSGLAFAFFPFIMENLDVDSVGPPPTE